MACDSLTARSFRKLCGNFLAIFLRSLFQMRALGFIQKFRNVIKTQAISFEHRVYEGFTRKREKLQLDEACDITCGLFPALGLCL